MPTPSQSPRIDYRFTPSQLDAFQDFLDSEYTWERFWGNAEEPSKSAEEYAAECEKKLIDAINRCPKMPNEAADKGTCFNEAVDCIIHQRKCEYEGMTVAFFPENNDCLANLNGFYFHFDLTLLYETARRFPNAISQYLCGAPLQTSKGVVWLYGYPDEWCGCRISDIKTTGDYKFGKFERKWQRHVYSYAIVESGDSTEITEFEYTAVELTRPSKKRPMIYGKIYPEVYTYDHEQSRRALQDRCERFIEWLEHRRGLITDLKIFGGENPPDYVGTPIDISVLSGK
ncbi:MAG: hypothetical protein K2O54_01285 [Prevotella sp.]|nr:hypothetical protein [Prevotella sp.]